MQRVCLLFSLLAAGCSFQVGAVGGDGGAPPPGRDSGAQSTDLAAAMGDLAGPAGDLAAMPDLLGRFQPSHVDPMYYKPTAPDLSGANTIDTHNLTIDGATPAGGTFVHDSHGWAV